MNSFAASLNIKVDDTLEGDGDSGYSWASPKPFPSVY